MIVFVTNSKNRYLYFGLIDLKDQECVTLLKLQIAAEQLDIQRLINFTQTFLIQNCYKFLQSDSIKIFNFLFVNSEFFTLKNELERVIELKEIFLKTVCENPQLLFNSTEFISLEKEALILILNCDNLDMKECEIWDRLIEWGIAQDPTQESDVTKYTNEDFRTLENKLHELIQVVRFHQINGEEFMLKVWPYKHLLPDNLVGDLLRCYLVSNPEPHHHLFPIRLGHVTNSNYAVYCHNDYGPTFGGGPTTGFTFGGRPTVGGSATFGGFGGGTTFRNPQTSGGIGGSHDLYVPSNGAVWQCNVHSYPNIGIPNAFAVSDYEVFQVVKN
ncbi:kelch-like protein 17 [Gigaspora margarita]|uniref:Kelch-like protein 17 n=1 Tax=Gigaspora margarita TaxID=4874 RepID=A0A8H4AKV6_GIGMA|nr:kelch-like protein 17 [Gigaspora margarita]